MYTHLYDIICKASSLILGLSIATLIPNSDNDPMTIIIGGLTLFVGLYFGFFRTLSSLAYCKFTLKMDITFSQAKQLNPALSPLTLRSLHWLPLKEIKTLLTEQKLEAALATQAAWLAIRNAKRKQVLPQFLSSSIKTKTVTLLGHCGAVYFGIATFVDLPPCSWLNAYLEQELYIKAPMLSFILFAAPWIVLMRQVDKNAQL